MALRQNQVRILSFRARRSRIHTQAMPAGTRIGRTEVGGI